MPLPMISRPPSLRADRRGNVAVEFALIVPIVLMIIMGIFEFGQALRIYNTLAYAVEQAGRYAMVNTDATTTEVEDYTASQLIGVNASTVTIAATTEVDAGTTYSVITADTTYDINVPFMTLGSVPLRARARVPHVE